jgi:hypothetical protein
VVVSDILGSDHQPVVFFLLNHVRYRVEISNSFAALENLDAEVDINRQNVKISAQVGLRCYALNHHKPWFDEGCSKLLDQREKAKLQWLENPSEINDDNQNKVRREARSHFRNKTEGISERQIKGL